MHFHLSERRRCNQQRRESQQCAFHGVLLSVHLFLALGIERDAYTNLDLFQQLDACICIHVSRFVLEPLFECIYPQRLDVGHLNVLSATNAPVATRREKRVKSGRRMLTTTVANSEYMSNRNMR